MTKTELLALVAQLRSDMRYLDEAIDRVVSAMVDLKDKVEDLPDTEDEIEDEPDEPE
mgnify:CR=1 FL=1